MKAKKIIIGVLGSLIGFLLILGLIGAFLLDGDGSGGAPEKGDYYDPRLEELRERSAELDEVYEGTAEELGHAEAGEDPFASQGELSDFDNFDGAQEEPARDSPKVEIEDAPSQEKTHSFGEPTAPLDAVQPEDEMRESVRDDSVASIGDTSRKSPFDNIPTAGDGITDDDLDEAIKGATRNLVRQEALELFQARQERRLNNIDQTLREVPELIQQGVSAALEESGDAKQEVAEQIEALTQRIASLEAKKRAKPTRPSGATLRNLYRIKRISGDTALLIGQNSGREFTFRVGDSIAYGGTVTRIKGDSVTLRWPNTQTTLSIY